MEIALAAATSARLPVDATLLIPVGSTRPHGPILPLDTDTEIASAVADLAARMLRRRRMKVAVAPPFAYGVGGASGPAPGAVTMGSDLLASMLVAVATSASTWARRSVFVNAGDGNLGPVKAAVAELNANGHDVVWTDCTSEWSGSALARTETSLMLHLQPWKVRSVRVRRTQGGARPGDQLASLGPSISDDQWLAAAIAASADEGREVLDHLAWRTTREVLDQLGLQTG